MRKMGESNPETRTSGWRKSSAALVLVEIAILVGAMATSSAAQTAPTPPPPASPPATIPSAGASSPTTSAAPTTSPAAPANAANAPQGTAVPPPNYSMPGLNGAPLVPPEPPSQAAPAPTPPPDDLQPVLTPAPTGPWWPYNPRGGMFYRSRAYGLAKENYGADIFVPFHSDPESSLGFFDIRYFKTFDYYDNILNADYINAQGLNAGVVYRRYGRGNRIYGANLYYDYRETGAANFNQIGFGLETLGEVYDGRVNFYIPFETIRTKISDQYVNPRFVPGAMLLDRQRVFQAAMTGFDIEGGRLVPYTGQMLKAFVGGYAYGANGTDALVGWKVRLEARLTDMASVELASTQDTIFGNIWTFGARINYPGTLPRNRPLVPRPVDRMGEYVVRNTNITVVQEVFTETLQATQDGEGVVAVFIDPGSLVGTYGDIDNVLILNDGTYTGGLVLQAGQGVLGASGTYPINVDQGYFDVPSPSTGTSTINANNYMAGVTLNIGNTVSSLTINNGTYGISGIAADGGTIYNNTITGASTAGINLSNATGVWSITSNSVSGTLAGDGIYINNTGTTATYTLSSNTTNSNTGDGIDVVANNGGNITLTISDSTSSSNTNSSAGIRLTSQGLTSNSTMTATVTSNTLQSNGTSGSDQAGLIIQAGDTSTINASATSNTISSNNFAGVIVRNMGNSTTEAPSITATVSSNTISSNSNSASATTGGGLLLYAATGNPTFSLTADSNIITSNAYNGVLFETDGSFTGTPVITATISNSTIQSNGTSSGFGAGVAVLAGGTSQGSNYSSLTISGNSITNNAEQGIYMDFNGNNTTNSTQATVYVQNNTISSNAYQGMLVDVGLTGDGTLIGISTTSNTFSSTTANYSSMRYNTYGTGTAANTLNLGTSSNVTDMTIYLDQTDTSTFNYDGSFPNTTTGAQNQVLSDNPSANSVTIDGTITSAPGSSP